MILCVVHGLSSCKSKPREPRQAEPDAAAIERVDSTPEIQSPLRWTDSAVLRYIERSDAPLIANSRHRGAKLSWITDRMQATDSGEFIVIQIGHDEAEPDGSNLRFATEGWLYLDTSRKRIYEYDLQDEALSRWE